MPCGGDLHTPIVALEIEQRFGTESCVRGIALVTLISIASLAMVALSLAEKVSY